jgi:ligand-binding sensor domain-containing protein/signal transduction histidine kinase
MRARTWLTFARKLAIGGHLLLLQSPTWPLDPGTRITQYVHEAWQRKDGLPEASVLAMAQTRDGYLWVGTYEGLARFDGVQFTVFNRSNTPVLKNSEIHALLEDRDGALWIGTLRGVVRYTAGVFEDFNSRLGLTRSSVSSIVQDRRGALWFGTEAGLIGLANEQVIRYTTSSGLPDNRIRSVIADAQGALWIATMAGLARFEHGEFTKYQRKDGLTDQLVLSVYQDRKSRVWAGARRGLYYLADGRFHSVRGLEDEGIWTVREDSEGNLWLGTASKGLVRLEGAGFASFSKQYGLTRNDVRLIFEDRERSLWIGPHGGGLNRLRDGALRTFGPPEGLPSEGVFSVLGDSAGRIWVGTREDLFTYEGGRFFRYQRDGEPRVSAVNAFCESRDGGVWVGTDDGLDQVREGRRVRLVLPELKESVTSLAEDFRGDLWIGTSGGGLYRYSHGRISSVARHSELKQGNVNALAFLQPGQLWISARGQGLFRLREDRIEQFRTGFSGRWLGSLYPDGRGSLWVGGGGGLHLIRDGVTRSFNLDHGLPTDGPGKVLEDDAGNLWLSSNMGIIRVSRKDLESGTRAIQPRVYGVEDGLRSENCYGNYQSNGCRSRDGKLWFASDRGLVMADPRDLRINQRPPPVVIEQVLIDRQPVAGSRRVELKAGQRDIEFRYTALTFVAPGKVRFRHRLEGHDRDWIEAGPRRAAFYSGLRPGQYEFRVIACNSDGVWNEKGASLAIMQVPAFHQTKRFYLLCVGTAAFFMYGIYRLRLRQLRARFSVIMGERLRWSREVHDTLAQGLAGISLQLESVVETQSEQPEEARRHMDRARFLARDTLAEARRLVTDLRPGARANGDLSSAVVQLAGKLSTATGIPVPVRCLGRARPLKEEARTGILRVFQEAVTNAIRHSGATEIAAELEFGTDNVRLRVVDHGCGFEAENVLRNPNGHFGLLGMRERVQALGGTFELETAPGRGATVAIMVPLRGDSGS